MRQKAKLSTWSCLIVVATLILTRGSIVRAAYTPYYHYQPTYGGYHPVPAYHPYYGSYGYGGYGASSSKPIISLELNPQKGLDRDLRIAARDERVEDLEGLIRKGGNVNSKSDDGETALMYAARNCSLKTVNVLLKHHAKVGVRDDHGRTALIYAIMDSCLPVSKQLLKYGKVAGLANRDDTRQDGLDYAEQGASLDVDGPSVELLNLVRKSLASYKVKKPLARNEIKRKTRIR